MKQKYQCKNFSECDFADEGEVFELEEFENNCPNCKKDQLTAIEVSNTVSLYFKKSFIFGVVTLLTSTDNQYPCPKDMDLG